jgi:hypothetical protein
LYTHLAPSFLHTAVRRRNLLQSDLRVSSILSQPVRVSVCLPAFAMPVIKERKLGENRMVIRRPGLDNKPLFEELSDG